MFFSKRVKLSVSFLVGNMTNLQVSTCNIGTGLAGKKIHPHKCVFFSESEKKGFRMQKIRHILDISFVCVLKRQIKRCLNVLKSLE